MSRYTISIGGADPVALDARDFTSLTRVRGCRERDEVRMVRRAWGGPRR